LPIGSVLSVFYGLPDPPRNRRRRFVARERDRPFEALWPRDETPDAGPGRARGDPGFVRRSGAVAGGGNGRV
jgi:hypothetical protein